jgi:Zn-dependent protease
MLIAFVNLLPGLPLDGGRLIRAVLWRVTGDRAWATRWVDRLGLGLGVAFSIGGIVAAARWGVGVGFWIVVVGLFLLLANRQKS